ncbi:MAG: hypothetical protein RO257_01665 [Candidatus Kapabacteria bacterium]|nr:hypothetical protein [Candidatus Kapabacteria bacterium]
MKTLFLLLAMLFISINLHANPPDSCLWAPENPIGPVFSDESSHNLTPTIKIDTCGLYAINPGFYWYYPDGADTSGSYYLGYPSTKHYNSYLGLKRIYSKSIWGIKMTWAVFDTAGKDLNTLHYFTVDDIDTKNQEIYDAFQQVKQTYGNIKFWFHFDKNISIYDAWVVYFNGNDSGFERGESVYIESENFINTVEFAEFVNILAPNVECKYLTEFWLPLSVKEYYDEDVSLTLSLDYESLLVETNDILSKIIIYSFTGNKLLNYPKIADGTKDIQINISALPIGVYFIQINNTFHKFMVVR